jgi:hypothetical protein
VAHGLAFGRAALPHVGLVHGRIADRLTVGSRCTRYISSFFMARHKVVVVDAHPDARSWFLHSYSSWSSVWASTCGA